MKRTLVVLAAAIVAAAVIGTSFASRQRSPVVMVELPLKLPAVGNLDSVKLWRFGRIQGVEQGGTGPDITILMRTEGGSVLRILAPASPLGELARRSRWLTSPDQARPSRSDYAERMVAFDVDAKGRLIAMMSMEPVSRDPRRLQRALSR